MLVLMNIEMALGDLGCTSISVAATISDALALLDGGASTPLCSTSICRASGAIRSPTRWPAGIPFAFSTGYGDHGDRADFANRPVLRKPYARGHLAAVLGALVAPGPRGAAA